MLNMLAALWRQVRRPYYRFKLWRHRRKERPPGHWTHGTYWYWVEAWDKDGKPIRFDE